MSSRSFAMHETALIAYASNKANGGVCDVCVVLAAGRGNCGGDGRRSGDVALRGGAARR